MMKKNRQLKLLTIWALFLSIIGLIGSYVAMDTALGIKEVNHFWKMNIVDVLVETDGPSSFWIDDNDVLVKSTSLSNINVRLSGKSSVTYKFKVRNSGKVDALLSVVNFRGADCTSTGNNNNCDKVNYKLVYSDGRDVLHGDVVNTDTQMTMNFVISYEGEENTEVVIEDIDFMMLYEQV